MNSSLSPTLPAADWTAAMLRLVAAIDTAQYARSVAYQEWHRTRTHSAWERFQAARAALQTLEREERILLHAGPTIAPQEAQ